MKAARGSSRNWVQNLVFMNLLMKLNPSGIIPYAVERVLELFSGTAPNAV